MSDIGYNHYSIQSFKFHNITYYKCGLVMSNRPFCLTTSNLTNLFHPNYFGHKNLYVLTDFLANSNFAEYQYSSEQTPTEHARHLLLKSSTPSLIHFVIPPYPNHLIHIYLSLCQLSCLYKNEQLTPIDLYTWQIIIIRITLLLVE